MNQRPSARQAPISDQSIDWLDFRKWLNNKYSKTWVPTVFCYVKYHEMLNGDFREFESFSKSKKSSVLKSLVTLSKYLGVYRQFKSKMADYGVKWESQNSFESFVRIREGNDGILEWVKGEQKSVSRAGIR